MRIISGYARGRRLTTPNTQLIRPTTDRVRESLFGILGELEDLVVVDGFAGSGALGCEALSRGAAFCYFFDPDRRAIELVQQNVALLEAQAQALIAKAPLTRGLSLLSHPVDLVFLDPPYHQLQLPQQAFDALAACPRLADGALLTLEQELDAPRPTHPVFSLEDERLYGRTRITFWRHAPRHER